jgi:hypothetical protein
MKPLSAAAAAAASISAGRASGRASAMFSPIVSLNSTASCGTTAIAARTLAWVNRLMS